MSLVVNYVKGLRGLKVKDLAPFTRQYAQEHLQPATLRYSARCPPLSPPPPGPAGNAGKPSLCSLVCLGACHVIVLYQW